MESHEYIFERDDRWRLIRNLPEDITAVMLNNY
jgi:hypothetical protein